MRNALRCILAATMFMTLTSCTASARGRITQLSEITLHPGANQVNMFVDDGRSGLITSAWRDVGQNTGYAVYTVMIPNQRRGWDIVPLETAAGAATDITGTARFARGWLDGKPTTFVFTARREDTDTAKPGTIVIKTYRLVTAREGEKSANAFVPVTTLHPSGKYCNPDAAIAHEFDLDGAEDNVRRGSCT